jgi:ParB family chromosome partitioning protein
LGKSRTLITNTLRILKLPEQIQNMLRNQQISMGHARALLGIDNPILQTQLAQEVAKKTLSVREVEKKVSQILNKNSQKEESFEKREKVLTEKYRSALLEIKRLRGFQLLVVETNEEKGKIEILFKNIEEFEKIIAFLSKEEYER